MRTVSQYIPEQRILILRLFTGEYDSFLQQHFAQVLSINSAINAGLMSTTKRATKKTILKKQVQFQNE